MTKKSSPPATGAAEPEKPAPAPAKVMLYVHRDVAFKFKEMALHERRKANDLYLEAIDQYLQTKGLGGLRGVIKA